MVPESLLSSYGKVGLLLSSGIGFSHAMDLREAFLEIFGPSYVHVFFMQDCEHAVELEAILPKLQTFVIITYRADGIKQFADPKYDHLLYKVVLCDNGARTGSWDGEVLLVDYSQEVRWVTKGELVERLRSVLQNEVLQQSAPAAPRQGESQSAD